ncbi:hypothetical protein LZ554_004983 [Drepanopeziza brunnea f. sp. 'monogermtubi']|nr:hypothetical protein LZ554_004983 [Drepanopeziza brunnea f. sp. 'monogermtubi']
MRFSASTILGALSIAHLAAAAPIWGAIMAGASVLLPSLVPGSFATFAIDRDRVLYLHTGSGPVQNFYVDRSGMGQGKLGYTTGDQPSPENAERRGWGVVDGFLYFDGAGLIACPSDIDDAWSVWVSVDVQDPGDNAGCTPFAARVDYLAEDGTAGSGPIPCEYTQ